MTTALEFLKITYRDDVTIVNQLSALCINVRENTAILEDYNV